MTRRINFALALIICVVPAYSEYYSMHNKWHVPKAKVTRLHFYLHDILSRQDPTAIRIAYSNLTMNDNTPTPFGSLYVIDDVLKVGPKLNSNIIGSAQRLYLPSSKDYSEFTMVLYIDFAFTTGKFNGSSISVFSRNPVYEVKREVAIVGVRGKFRMATGYVEMKTSYFNAINGDAILEYNATVFHC